MNFQHYDRFSPNLFAPDQVEDPELNHWGAVTMFEVWEHLINPIEELRTIASKTPIIIFTTELIPKGPPPRPSQWWYFAPETGQHVTFYTEASLRSIAESLGMSLHTNHCNLHVLAQPGKLSELQKVFIKTSLRLAPILARGLRRVQRSSSLTPGDYTVRLRELIAAQASDQEFDLRQE